MKASDVDWAEVNRQERLEMIRRNQRLLDGDGNPSPTDGE